MDSFTQRMLDKAEQRSRALGISNASKFPLAECSNDANSSSGATMASQQQKQQTQQLRQAAPSSAHASTNTGTSSKLQVVEKKSLDTYVSSSSGASRSRSPNKVLRQFSAVDKENMDLGIEINIMTDKNVEVQVQVEEQEITDDEEANCSENRSHSIDATDQPPVAIIRDTSRNRLQRLGALYSNTDVLSSPIHRTEAQFHAGSAEDNGLETRSDKPKQRYGKLAALANTINLWEDDTSHHHQLSAVPPPKPDLPSRRVGEASKKQRAPAPPAPPPSAPTATTAMQVTGDPNKTKQLKWDPKVMHSLEAQGFQRRESSTVKLAYNYAQEDEDQEEEQEPEPVQEAPKAKSEKPTVGKLASTYTAAATQDEKRPLIAEKKWPTVKAGLVSGRTAAFESKANVCQQQQRPQKDPTELSLKERMKLFEKNKGAALVPKAAFGMAPSISKIRQDNAAKKDEGKPSSFGASNTAAVKPGTDAKVRDKVAALVATATTISENKIKADINKQRQEDMQVLANRFNKQKEVFTKEQQHQPKDTEMKAAAASVGKQQSQVKATTAALITASSSVRPPPPPPPPMPQEVANALLSAKRRSPGDTIDESKRARTSNAASAATNRLYPALTDFESNESYSDDDNCCTTATVSGLSTDNEMKGRARVAPLDQRTEEDDNESYMESEANDSSVGICNGSLGREIMQVVHKNEQNDQQPSGKTKQIKEVRYAEKDHYYGGGGDSSMNSSEASMGVDDYLDEALDDEVDDGDDDYTQESGDDDEEDTSCASRGSKGTTASNSFSFRKTPRKYINCQTIAEEENDDYNTPTTSNAMATLAQPLTSELSVNQENANMVTLVHTVSFYRRQQSANSANSTPVRKISREQQVFRSATESGSNATATMQFDSPQPNPQGSPCESYSNESDSESDADVDNSHLVQEKHKKLLDEVCKQQQVIAQTSQALNLCAATIEFSGSTESVEGERHLLVATHRRQACLDEVQRLRVEKSLRPLGAPKEKGRLTVKEITVPLRQDYIRKLAADTISGHHLVCLLKYNEHVLATKTVPTLPGLLAVKFPDVLQLNNVYADFRVTLEIYGMTAQREVLPHEVKYHINLNKKSGVKTPKKKGHENRLVMPPVQSPAGPNVVRTPALVQYGFAIFSLREIQRTTWTLTQVLGVSPLDGAVHMKVNCELSVSVEYKGFLTMFEDISGFGAWHRRWCHLNGTMLNYWKYPDDELKKTPMGSVDLYTCSSQKVTTTPRDICARLNTMLLECQRPAKESDRESLIIVPNGRTTIVRHLLSADTKEEREEWCAYFNKALTLLRAWGPPQ